VYKIETYLNKYIVEIRRLQNGSEISTKNAFKGDAGPSVRYSHKIAKAVCPEKSSYFGPLQAIHACPIFSS
jgi:hypothetical protein